MESYVSFFYYLPLVLLIAFYLLLFLESPTIFEAEENEEFLLLCNQIAEQMEKKTNNCAREKILYLNEDCISMIKNVLNPSECREIIELSEKKGFETQFYFGENEVSIIAPLNLP